MNLNLFISRSGFCSRRKADCFIKSGLVKVGEKIVTEPWFNVPAGASVKVGNKKLKPEQKSYLIFNKPKGVTTTLEDKHAEKKISDFLPKSFGRLYPVGRLDKLSRGLILFTNDGEVCHKLTHPKFEVEKEYLILAKGKLNGFKLEKIKTGVEDKGDFLKVRSVAAEKIAPDRFRIRAIVCEGKKRHLRRLLKSQGMEVLDLQRIRIGSLKLGNLKEGAFKTISRDEIYNHE